VGISFRHLPARHGVAADAGCRFPAPAGIWRCILTVLAAAATCFSLFFYLLELLSLSTRYGETRWQGGAADGRGVSRGASSGNIASKASRANFLNMVARAPLRHLAGSVLLTLLPRYSIFGRSALILFSAPLPGGVCRGENMTRGRANDLRITGAWRRGGETGLRAAARW